jgi:iron complex transport system substrate-binding protein
LAGAALLAAGAVALPATASAVPPQRIVSLNLCTDQLLLELVPRGRIAGVSFLAADPAMSSLADKARGLPLVQGSAEEVLALDPDLVLAGEYSTPATVSLLERLGRRVVRIAMASSFAEIREGVRRMADAVGEADKGRALVAELDRRLAASAALADARRPTVIAMQVNSLAAAPGSLLDEVFAAAGLHNMAREMGLGPGGRLPLETLLLHPPDLLVLANAPADFRTVLGDNLRHPAFEHVARTRPSLHLPMADWLCGTPGIAGAVERLAGARRRLTGGGQSP